MTFKEIKNEKGYTYELEEVFGTISIDTQDRLNGDLLDDLVMLLLKQNLNAKEVSGTVDTDKGQVSYKFIKAQQWGEDKCENIPTKTKTPERRPIATGTLQKGNVWTRASKWLRKFAGVFHEAWKKASEEVGNSTKS